MRTRCRPIACRSPPYLFAFFFFFNDTATTEIYTLSHTTLFRSAAVRRPAAAGRGRPRHRRRAGRGAGEDRKSTRLNSSHVEISYAVFCLKKKKKKIQYTAELDNTDTQQPWQPLSYSSDDVPPSS